MREANDQQLPVVGIGIFYSFNNPIKLDLVKDDAGNPLRITVPIQDKNIWVQVFKYMVGNVPVYLMDTDVEENDLSNRKITQDLYVLDKEIRLKQELILGIGGLRVLEALNIHPQIYHLNEGHSAFLALELIRQEMQSHKVGLDEALVIARKKIVFTNHTLVAAGHDTYSNDLVALMLTGYAQELGIPVADVVELGLVQESSTFSMTMLSLRMAGKINAVSKLHAKKAADIWTNHPMIPITNGIHIPTWDIVKDLKNHHQCKKELLDFIGQQANIHWEPNQLVLGWARRLVEYKRPLAIFENLKRLISITKNTQYPVRIVFSAALHQSNAHGYELARQLDELIKTVGDSIVFIPKYVFNMDLAKKMVSGCDVWLNTPVVGFEACGTSGMKAALNGVLPCTTADGWVDEVSLDQIGWTLDSDHLGESILDVLERDVVPMYYTEPELWQQHMQNARNLVLQEFTATRMLTEYTHKLYL